MKMVGNAHPTKSTFFNACFKSVNKLCVIWEYNVVRIY